VLIEAARIARGAILPIAQASINDLDALIVPGGFGAAKNLSSFASLGSECGRSGSETTGSGDAPGGETARLYVYCACDAAKNL
jgi:hypothetical protein